MTNLLKYAFSFLHVPYLYGGNNSIEGVDCSAFCLELLRAAGEWGKSDASAQMIYAHFSNPKKGLKLQSHAAGAFIFYGKNLKNISHIDFALDNNTVIGAIGGTSKTKSLAEAKKQGAFVKLRPRDYRSDILAIIKPRYELFK
jgi:cell wall-associated NlpC family hydrolase